MTLPESLSKLEQEVSSFLSSNSPPIRRIVDEVINPLNVESEAYVIGGLIRDIALYGKDQRPSSDIDFVVKGRSSSVDKLALALNAKPNRFGGFGIKNKEFRVDFWSWNKTWAKTNGHVDLKSKKDICKTTFFDWDAIVYSTKTGRLTAIDGYLDRLNSRKLDINLLANPSILGSLVRSLRRLYMWNAKPTRNLSLFVYEHIKHYNWYEIQEAERNAFGTIFLGAFPDSKTAIETLVECDTELRKYFGILGSQSQREREFDLDMKEQWYFGPNFYSHAVCDTNSLIKKKKLRQRSSQMSLFD